MPDIELHVVNRTGSDLHLLVFADPPHGPELPVAWGVVFLPARGEAAAEVPAGAWVAAGSGSRHREAGDAVDDPAVAAAAQVPDAPPVQTLLVSEGGDGAVELVFRPH